MDAMSTTNKRTKAISSKISRERVTKNIKNASVA